MRTAGLDVAGRGPGLEAAGVWALVDSWRHAGIGDSSRPKFIQQHCKKQELIMMIIFIHAGARPNDIMQQAGLSSRRPAPFSVGLFSRPSSKTPLLIHAPKKGSSEPAKPEREQ